jgi:hypothetical protein
MKTTNKILVAALALGVSAFVASAQDNNTDGPPGGGQGMGRHRPPPPAIIGALDANHDGVIDADEIANASAALKTLDKNGDGKLTPDEFMGPRPKPPQGSGGNDAGGPPDGTPPPQQ